MKSNFRTNFKERPYVLITCEHADYKIPDFIKSKIPHEFSPLNLKKSHSSYDAQALTLSQTFVQELKTMGFKTDLIFYPFTRLIIDANRTPENKGFYSKLSPYLNEIELNRVKNEYLSYLKRAETLIQKHKSKRNIFIFSIHSFTPIFKNKIRKTDIGLLFRSKINKEKKLAENLKAELQRLDPSLNVHKNLPYRGHTDCFLNYILDQHKNDNSVNGLFFEFNQNLLSKKSIKFKKSILSVISKHFY